MMQLRILGCSGGIGEGLCTSSYLVDEDILLDAGTGVGRLSIAEMQQITHVFLTHSHMDHITSLPLLVDTLFSSLDQPLMVYARAETIAAFKMHIFNWQIWPDFSELPSKDKPVIEFREMLPGDVVEINGRRVEMIDVNHTVAAAAFSVSDDSSRLVYSGDTTTNDVLWNSLNAYESLDFMILESAFGNKDLELATLSKHYCPSLLAEDLKKLKHQPLIGISHLKPGEEKTIMEECQQAFGDKRNIKQLFCDDKFQI